MITELAPSFRKTALFSGQLPLLSISVCLHIQLFYIVLHVSYLIVSLLQKPIPDRNLATCAISLSACQVQQSRRPAVAICTFWPEMLSTRAWLAQPRCYGAVNDNAVHVRQDHWPVAGAATGPILNSCPEHQVFRVAPIAAPEVIIIIETYFHHSFPPLSFF